MAASRLEVSQDLSVKLEELKGTLIRYVISYKSKELTSFISKKDTKFETQNHAVISMLSEKQPVAGWCEAITYKIFGVSYGRSGDLGIARAREVYGLYLKYHRQGELNAYLKAYVDLLRSPTFNGIVGGSKHLENSCYDLLNKWMDLKIHRAESDDAKQSGYQTIIENNKILIAASEKLAALDKSLLAKNR